MEVLSVAVGIIYVNPGGRKNRTFPKNGGCGKTCGECGKLMVINKKTKIKREFSEKDRQEKVQKKFGKSCRKGALCSGWFTEIIPVKCPKKLAKCIIDP